LADAPTEPRILGFANDYGTLCGLLRARADELAVSRECIDAVSGLQPGYSGKLLSPIPAKAFGRTSLPLLLGGLAVKLAVVEDTEQLRVIAGRLEKRDMRSVHPRTLTLSTVPPDILEALRAEARAELEAEAQRRGRRSGHRKNGHNGHRKANGG
jgi:hypothetical protein